jgi:rhodanese-related sulfurtransferase
MRLKRADNPPGFQSRRVFFCALEREVIMANENGYAGDVSAREAWESLSRDPKAALIDVRTKPEWSFIGLPDLSSLNKQPLCICWQDYPVMQVNESFVQEVTAAGVAPRDPVYLLCRSGVRSVSAAQALTAAGFGACYNVADGFEGPHDKHGHRGGLRGWQAAELPWRQG